MEAVLNGPFGRVSLGPQPLTIGRTPDNQLILAEPKVSSHLAEIRPQGQDYALVDLGSTNGTFVNDQRLASNQPRTLRSGDVIVIGDTRFTYDKPGVSEIAPTVSAGSWQGNNFSNTPAGAPSSPTHTAYSPDAQQAGAYPPPPPVSAGYAQPDYMQDSPYYGAPVSSYGADAGAGVYQAPPPPPAYAGVQPPAYPQGDPYAGVQPPAYPQGAPYAPAPAVPPVPRPNRRRLGIILGAAGGVVVIAIVLFVVIGFLNRATPTATLNAYCNALMGGDYQSAYNQLSNSQHSIQTEAQFAANFSTSKVTNCSVSNVNDSAGTGTIAYTLSNGVSLTADETLINENGAWKINSERPRSTPTLTLATFCNAVKTGDYQTAYNQLSATEQSGITEAQMAASLSSNPVTKCTVSNVNDTAGTGTINYTFSNGNTSVIAYTLINDNGTWKINSGKQTG